MIYEYIWLDADQNIRSKTRIADKAEKWTFDGSSTGQSEGNNSDLILEPIRSYDDPFRKDGKLVLCEVKNADNSPHISNMRCKLRRIMNTHDPNYHSWVGFEQEYTLINPKTDLPFGWEYGSNGPGEFPVQVPTPPAPQGPYYCSVGQDNNYGREFAENHLQACLRANLKVSGINAEVMPGQWEIQIGAGDLLKISDDLIIARYLLYKCSEQSNYKVSLDPKPMEGWNGAGLHTNFSTKDMREHNGFIYINKAIDKLSKNHFQHLDYYGKDNEKRLTGNYETARYDKFTSGISDRGASVRIPLHVHTDKKGYFEDRRPAANASPYLVSAILLKTILGE